MYLCNQAIEDYPGVVQWKVHSNAIQDSLEDLAEKEARQTLRQTTTARNIGFRDIHDILKQGPPRRTTLKEGLLEEELLSELEVIAMDLKDDHDLYLWNQRRIELYILQTEMYLCNKAIEEPQVWYNGGYIEKPSRTV